MLNPDDRTTEEKLESFLDSAKNGWYGCHARDIRILCDLVYKAESDKEQLVRAIRPILRFLGKVSHDSIEEEVEELEDIVRALGFKIQA